MNFNFQNIVGFDISTYQDAPSIPGNVNFQKMRDGGASFVIIKAGQGDWKDPDFDTSWKNAKGVLPRSSYFYYDNRYPPKEQARIYWDIIRADPEGMCWLDLEDRTVTLYSFWNHWYAFLSEFQFLSGKSNDEIGIYTGYYFFAEKTASATVFEQEWFGRFPLWLAAYTADPFKPNYEDIKVPYPWTEPLILQSGTPAIGYDAGVESEDIDYNQWNSNFDFSNYFRLTEPLPPTNGEPTMPEYRYEAQSNTNAGRALRPFHNTNNDPLMYVPATALLYGDTLWIAPVDLYLPDGRQINKAGDKWLRVEQASVDIPAAEDIYIAIRHNGVDYCTLIDNGEPAEPEPPADVHPVSGTVEVTLSDGSVWRGTAGEWTRQ